MEKGDSNDYRGKSLDEININVEELVSDEDNLISDFEDDNLNNEDDPNNIKQITTSQSIEEPIAITRSKKLSNIIKEKKKIM